MPGVMRTPLFWYLFLVLVCIVGPYLLGVRPVTRAHWAMLTVAIVFLTWLLVGLVSVRS
jgi:hypothetical protein